MSSGARGLASFHVFTVAPARIPAALIRMAVDRARLPATPGLTFFKLVGTGDGRTFTVRDSNPCRWGLFAVWDDRASLERFEQRSGSLRSWNRVASERWRLDLAPVRSRGRWGGREPFAGRLLEPTGNGPVAAITRARIDWRMSRRFWSAVPPVSHDLHRQPGVRFAMGFGEAPVGLQGTLSVWNSLAAMRAFAHEGDAHRQAVVLTHELCWYTEELFARFEVLGSTGTVAGRDPLAGTPAGQTRPCNADA